MSTKKRLCNQICEKKYLEERIDALVDALQAMTSNRILAGMAAAARDHALRLGKTDPFVLAEQALAAAGKKGGAK